MSLDSKNGSLIIRPATTYWNFFTSPIATVYSLSLSGLSVSAQFLSSIARNFFQKAAAVNVLPSVTIAEKSIQELHATKSLKGDSLTKQIQRDIGCMTVLIEGEKQTSVTQLQQSAEKLLKKVSSQEPSSECLDRVLRICQQAIFQPGFAALKEKLSSTHIVLQESSIPLEISLNSNGDKIEAVGTFGVRIYPTTDFDELDQIPPKVYCLQSKIPQVFLNKMFCDLKEVPQKDLKKIK